MSPSLIAFSCEKDKLMRNIKLLMLDPFNFAFRWKVLLSFGESFAPL
jgi:hypothetical protein